MSEHNPANVLAAFQTLLREVEAEINWVNQSGAVAFNAGDHARAAKALERAQKLSALRSDLRALGEALRGLMEPQGGEARPTRAHLRKGLKTPEHAYRLPILRALVEMGGSGKMSAVLDRVYLAMKDTLNEHDLAPMPSDERCPRWRNTAQWARNALRAEGLLKADSPRGIWEITPAGRATLAHPPA